MVAVKKDVVINAPLETVFALVSDPARMPEWLPGLVEVRVVLGTGAGQQFEWTYKMAGILLRGQSVVVEFVPNERAVHQNIGGISSTWTYTVEPHDEGTTLTIEADYTIPVPVLGKMAEHVAARRNARDLEAALLDIKETLES
jgi:uncharacterized protein YndB with AHSA1/START domain